MNNLKHNSFLAMSMHEMKARSSSCLAGRVCVCMMLQDKLAPLTHAHTWPTQQLYPSPLSPLSPCHRTWVSLWRWRVCGGLVLTNVYVFNSFTPLWLWRCCFLILVLLLRCLFLPAALTINPAFLLGPILSTGELGRVQHTTACVLFASLHLKTRNNLRIMKAKCRLVQYNWKQFIV